MEPSSVFAHLDAPRLLAWIPFRSIRRYFPARVADASKEYDPVRAHHRIWQGVPAPDPLPPLSAAERGRLSFPALAWLDDGLARLPSSLKILAYMPVHVAALPAPGTRAADAEAECKTRVAAIGRKRGAVVIDWRIPSPMTHDDTNCWDSVHYRVPIATRIAGELAAAAAGKESEDGTYVLVR
jgi:hypothetical protein